jgi:hypothetical protein
VGEACVAGIHRPIQALAADHSIPTGTVEVDRIVVQKPIVEHARDYDVVVARVLRSLSAGQRPITSLDDDRPAQTELGANLVEGPAMNRALLA